jgi:hypothetical protein
MTAEYFEQDSPQGLEPGVYPATLTAIEDVVVKPYSEAERPDNGERWRFTWAVDVVDEPEPVTLTQLTSRKLNDFPTTAWKILTALGYRGGKVARSEFIGKRCQLTLGLKPTGWNSFDAYSPIREPAKPGTAQAMRERLASQTAAAKQSLGWDTGPEEPLEDLAI